MDSIQYKGCSVTTGRIAYTCSVRAIISLTPFYIVERLVLWTNYLCTKQENSSIFEPKIHGLYSRAGYNGGRMVIQFSKYVLPSYRLTFMRLSDNFIISALIWHEIVRFFANSPVETLLSIWNTGQKSLQYLVHILKDMMT